MSRPLLLTRPATQSAEFAAELARLLPGRFGPVVVAPLLEIVLHPAPVDLDGVSALVFSSANGVDAFVTASPERGLPALCVGEMTAAAAREAGFTARSADGDVVALAALGAASWKPGDGTLLHVRGRHAAGDLIGALADKGVPARAVELYEQVAQPLSSVAKDLMARGEGVVVPLFSPRTARILAREAAGIDLTGVTFVGISDAAVAPLVAGRRIVTKTPGRAGMVEALAEL